jgi:hypothetical protein
VLFTKEWFSELPVSADAIDLMQRSVALPLRKYRKCLAKEREKGNLAHRRYTFTQYPMLQISDDEFISLRPLWVLERFCGPQLYWETFFGRALSATRSCTGVSLTLSAIQRSRRSLSRCEPRSGNYGAPPPWGFTRLDQRWAFHARGSRTGRPSAMRSKAF